MGQCQAHFSILILGLEKSGKLTLLNSIDKDKTQRAPTGGYVQTVRRLDNGITLFFSKLSSTNISLWKEFLPKHDALLWVIDISEEKFQHSLQSLKTLLTGDPTLPPDSLVIIYLNKYDLWVQKPERASQETMETNLREGVKNLKLPYKIRFQWGVSLNVESVQRFCETLSEDIAEEKDPLVIRMLRQALN